MANNFIDQKDRWLQIANGDFEYSILFIKCWLPFNAWYCNNYPQFKNQDSAILREVKTDDNLFRTRLISLLENDDEDSIFFRNQLIILHKQLERCKVPNIANSLSFKSINFRTNPNPIFTKDYNKFNFKIELLVPIQPHNIKIRVDVLKNRRATMYTYQHTKYDFEHFINDPSFIALSEKNKEILKDGFKQINPKIKESLIVEKKKDSLQNIGSVFFKNDTNLLSQAIIEIIYNLRCILFHGEIQPNKDNLKIYEPAYYMLKLLIKSLD